ncbi:hypothetical protein EDB86DRAFT_1385469 [Lactarius hatsudake]|nr:hypothetical protein EDB86DRAFT_1385469 [Lactarius hatsudake]
MGEKKNCWACHYCNTVRLPPPSPLSPHPPLRLPAGIPSSLPPHPRALRSSEISFSEKNAASRLPLPACVSNVVNVCACACVFLSSSFFSVGHPSRFGENGQRKRKIARFPCDRHPIEIGGTSSPMARPLPAPLGLERCVVGTGVVGTWHAEIGKKNLGLLYWCTHHVPGHRPYFPLFCVLLVPCSETSDPPFDGFPERAENEKKPTCHYCQPAFAFVWTNSGIGSSISLQ